MATRPVAIVTGASRGIGCAAALRLAKDGYNVVITYKASAEKAQAAVEHIHSSTDAKAIAVKSDAGSFADGQRLIDETLKEFGRIDTVVFNAALIVMESVHDVTEESYEEAFRVNVKAPMFFTKQVIPHLTAGARLIYLSSSLTSMTNVLPSYFLYCATKGAVEQMVRVLAKDLAGKGINVNCINPGPTDTDGLRHGKTEEQLKFLAGLAPSGQLGQTDDIASAISFLASKDSAWVNGQILRVNGALAV